MKGPDRSKPTKYMPRNNGTIHAVLWTGKASCLIGMPKFDEIICAIQDIDHSGLLMIETDQITVRVRPTMDYIVIDSFGRIEVYQKEFLHNNYEPMPE